MNVSEVVKSKKCAGCSACSITCPVNAIVMREDTEGFSIPIIDDSKCVNCSMCVQICPSSEAEQFKHKINNAKCFIAQSKNTRRKKSASGGMFYTIALEILNNQGVIFGAAFCEENVVKHIQVDNINDLMKLQNSKYVQSNIGDTYISARDNLEQGRWVLFSGTPCQIAGLYSFLGKDFANLITIDIICHGVPSPKLLRRQIEEESKTWQGKVKKVSFRYKNPVFKSSSSFYMMMMMMMRGLPKIRRPGDDPYFNIFSKGYAFRESCYCCPWASPDRVGDFTLGDCDSHRLYPDFHPYESNSTVILNTKKAFDLWEKAIKKMCDYQDLNITEEIKCNKQLGRPSERPENRDVIYHELDNLTWKEFSDKYANRQSWIGKMRTYSALIMPNFIIRMWGKLHG